jgi:hypothetical protein
MQARYGFIAFARRSSFIGFAANPALANLSRRYSLTA